ncbi:amino acid ABC transporter substrate-binding protein, PAAT family [Aeromonas sp. RU39B]|uniref:transporter substrate-binding domain-containing protein n=1 Tax=Aeromonas sp. RU39B TaxID=1907416 RepID=UPI000956A34E|nr:transporter substrate-binding domain-containing protein [Aeromonas sp. RU39B]SIR21005.1 amino acid ABC transporter substrate-binding protein, PAAT family [Aeromonas sp. RU39B]
MQLKKKNLHKALALLGGVAMLFSVGAKAADLPEIEKAGVLKIATEDDYAPFNFMKDGQPDGFHKDVLDELKTYAKTFKLDQSILPWTGLLAAVSAGQYDIAITGALVTDERLKVFNFAYPFASAQSYYVKRAGDDSIKSVADLSGKTLGVQAGSALLSRLPELKAMLAKTGGKLGEVVEYQSYPEAYADLANGRLDYVVDAVIPINSLVKTRAGVFEKGQPVSGGGFVCWPIPKNSPKLLEYMNGFMKHLKESGKLHELQIKWFGEPFDNLPQEAITTAEQFHKLAGL